MLTPADHRYELACSLVEWGAALRRANQRAAARQPLHDGLDLAVQIGAASLADRANTELVASGARPRRTRATGRDALTASELRVAGLAATGLPNVAIAQQLYVSHKTVEKHLTAAFAKLGVTQRDGLAAALA